jgi:hypothetical protein
MLPLLRRSRRFLPILFPCSCAGLCVFSYVVGVGVEHAV